MWFVTRFGFAARAWHAALLAFAVITAGIVFAQAPVTRAEIPADVLLALLGSGRAIEISLPDDVRVVHVVAAQGNAVVVERRTDVGAGPEGRADSIVVSVGGLGAMLRCPLLVFVHVSRERAGRALGGGMTTTCIEVNGPVALWPAPRPGLRETSFDVGTWYAIDGFWPTDVTLSAPQPTPEDLVVFHVYLATDDTDPPYDELGITDR